MHIRGKIGIQGQANSLIVKADGPDVVEFSVEEIIRALVLAAYDRGRKDMALIVDKALREEVE